MDINMEKDRNFKESRTYKNLMQALDGELKAFAKYQIFADKAEEEELIQIRDVFEETAHNEKEHAEIWLKLLNNGELPDTLENLYNASEGEYMEWTTMYQNFANIAAAEGYEQIAELFRGVAQIEQSHDYRFRQLRDQLEKGMLFCKTGKVMWICLNCGNMIWAECAPEKCPVCGYPKGFYYAAEEG